MPTALPDTDEWVAAPDGPATAEPRTSTLMRSYLGKVNQRARWLYNRLTDILGTWNVIEAVDATLDRLTITAHAIASNTAVRVYSVGGTVPAGLSDETAYYVEVIDSNTIKLSATSGPGSAVNITGAGSGTLYLFQIPDVTANLLTQAVSVGGTSVPAGTLKSIFAQCFTALGGTFTGPVILNGGAGRLTYTPVRTLTRVQGGILVNADTDVSSPLALNVAAGENGFQRLERIPNGATLSQVTLYHNRNNTGTLPTTRVLATLVKISVLTGAATTIAGPTEDPTNTLAPYEAHHAFSLSGLSEVIDNERFLYYVLFEGEGGANTTFTLWYPAICTFNVPDQDEAP